MGGAQVCEVREVVNRADPVAFPEAEKVRERSSGGAAVADAGQVSAAGLAARTLALVSAQGPAEAVREELRGLGALPRVATQLVRRARLEALTREPALVAELLRLLENLTLLSPPAQRLLADAPRLLDSLLAILRLALGAASVPRRRFC
jgi:hypothetical protein